MKNIFSENTNFNIYINKPVFIIKYDDTKDKNTSNFPQKSKECELITNNNNLEKNTNLIFSINNNINKTCPYCHSTFQSKYNMERHVRTIHEKNYLFQSANLVVCFLIIYQFTPKIVIVIIIN